MFMFECVYVFRVCGVIRKVVIMGFCSVIRLVLS